MYKSPIHIIYGQMETQMEGTILKAVQNVGVNVDKEELLLALKYDRKQYLIGYEDGEADALESIVRCKDCKHCIYNSYVLGDVRCGYLHTDYIKENSFCSYGERRVEK